MPAFFSLEIGLASSMGTQRHVGFVAGEQPGVRMVPTPVLPQLHQQFFRKDGVAVFSAFALFYPDHHPGGVTFNVVRL
jgi:hypothetical protein